MDLKNKMIIINDKIVTSEISTCEYNPQAQTYTIEYQKNKKIYQYSKKKVKILTQATKLNLQNNTFFLKNKLLTNIKEVIEFTDEDGHYYYHVTLSDNSQQDYTNQEFQRINISAYENLEYMKKVADVISLSTEDGKKILSEQMKKIKIDSLDIALANYLKLSNAMTTQNKIKYLIFPFGCNSSQYKAVENAIYNKISIIEGPPGTGKTQTILNLIANIIIRKMNCQVVSNNNTAIENIDEKLKRYELDFIEAVLGKKANKDSFIENQKEHIPSFTISAQPLSEIASQLKKINELVKKIYEYRKEIALLIQKKKELTLEYKYFIQYLNNQKIEIIELSRYNKENLKRIWSEIINLNKLSLWKKIKYIYIYQTGSYSFYTHNIEKTMYSIQKKLYQLELEELEKKIIEKEKFVQANQNCEKEFVNLSMEYLKKYLALKYKTQTRKKYSAQEIKHDCQKFVDDYPVILSTTHSSRNTFDNEFKFDYIIMDEASQVDVVTGSLALSSAKYAVIIGDEKQLQNVVTPQEKLKVDVIFNQYSLHKGYSYSLNSFLKSIKQIIPDAPITLLQEHYRCHPKIIDFCNKKFYANQLIIMTQDHDEKEVIKIIKTNKGNHSRNDHTNQRQLDIIKELIPNLKSKDIGIIAPYNNQVKLMKQTFPDIEVSTVHKFQGREKDIIILSTVEDDINDFVARDNILNVAISRAKKQLICIVTGNQIKNQNINDFINYAQYNNMEVTTSKIYSVFDLLYKQYEEERLKFYKKHTKVSKYNSENFAYHLIHTIIKDYDNLDFIFLQPLKALIKDPSLLTEREIKYASHHSTHIDFLVYNKFNKKPVLAIEVDGYKYHKEGTKQYKRDLLKNSILEKYKIPLIKLKTNGSGEEERIRECINRINKHLYRGS